MNSSRVLTPHQQKQIELIDAIETQVNNNTIQFSTVPPIKDYTNDPRLCLTSVHFPEISFLKQIQKGIILPLQQLSPNHLYYDEPSLHMTIKNIRIIHDPPRFTFQDINSVKEVFSDVIPQHSQFRVYFYRLLLFKHNVAIMGTTDPELDSLIQDLDVQLTNKGVPDDKIYANNQYFFSNMTIARFTSEPSQAFINLAQTLTQQISLAPYTVNSVSLVTANAVFANPEIHATWNLRLS